MVVDMIRLTRMFGPMSGGNRDDARWRPGDAVPRPCPAALVNAAKKAREARGRTSRRPPRTSGSRSSTCRPARRTPALAARRGLGRPDDEQLRILQLVPPRIA